MLQDDGWTAFYRDPVSDTTLVRRINRALADSGLRLQTARKGSLIEGLAGRHYFIYGKRAFRLRVGIDELARALGILHQFGSAKSDMPQQVAHGCVNE